MNKNKGTGKGSIPPGADGPSEYDFRHHLHDTIILLGGEKKIADMLVRSQDSHIKNSDVAEVRRYNGVLIDETKDRLNNVHKTRVRPKA